MDVNFNIPKEARESLLTARKWRGDVTMEVVPIKGDRNLVRLSLIQEDSDRLQELRPDEARLVNAWNDDPYITGRARAESRNFPISDGDAVAHRATLRKAIDDVGMDKLLARMRGYMDACSDGRHIWANAAASRPSNHGYKNLIGFLQKLILLKRKGKGSPWWMRQELTVEDDHPKMTQLVADVFARKLLGRQKFGLTPSNRAYAHFRNAADRVAMVAGKNKWGLDAENVVASLIECLSGYITGGVSPGNLVSDHLWMVALPQYLKRRYE